MRWILLVFLLISCQDEDMRLFQTGLGSEGVAPPTESDLAPDGYLYILSFGQSNWAGTEEGTEDWLPLTGDASLGDRTALPSTCTVAWNDGTWRQMAYGDGVIYDADNLMAFAFCRDLANDYPELVGNGIRLVFIAQGGAAIEQFMVGGVKYAEMEVMYNAFTMGDDIYPAPLLLMHQGESNDGDGIDVYVPKWDECVGQYATNGWTKPYDETKYIVGEVGRTAAVQQALHFIGQLNQNRRIVQCDGTDMSYVSHFLGTGYVQMGQRYLERYLEMALGNLPPEYEVRPQNVTNVISSDIDATGCTLTWDYPNFTGADIFNGQTIPYDDIQGFSIFGWGGRKHLFDINDKNTLTTSVEFSLPSGSTERFGIQAFDSFGNHSFFVTYNWWVDVIVP